MEGLVGSLKRAKVRFPAIDKAKRPHGGGNHMRKLMVLVAMLAMALVFVVPVVAQEFSQSIGEGISQDSEMEADSGEVDQSFTVTGSGDNSNQCSGVSGVTNTGNSQPVTQVIQYNSVADDFEFEGGGAQIIQANSEAGDFEFEGDSDITVDGTNETTCGQKVNQAAGAG